MPPAVHKNNQFFPSLAPKCLASLQAVKQCLACLLQSMSGILCMLESCSVPLGSAPSLRQRRALSSLRCCLPFSTERCAHACPHVSHVYKHVEEACLPDFQANLEEAALLEIHSEYPDYQKKVPKLIPYIY